MTAADWGGLPLSPAHREMVEASGITVEVARERGYRTVSTKTELRDLGFSTAQQLVPCLLLPIANAHGETVLYQIRPDRPRIKDGKPLKYETPTKARMALDVPFRTRPLLGSPDVPLFITEGARKADAATSHGLCCVSLLGVWNFRGRNDDGGLTALGDWEAVHLRERAVYVVFDSDVMEKSAVRLALERLGRFLESRRALVRYVYLPSGPGGTKVGLDDFLASGRTVDDLFALASSAIRGGGDRDPAADYAATEQGLVWHRRDAFGTTSVRLANFTARIVEDRTEDDGAEARRLFMVEAKLRGEAHVFALPAHQFAGMQWAAEHLGPTAILEPGQGVKERTRVAIQELSGEVPRHVVYAHTGWRRLGERWVYLHAGGGIDGDGARADVSVALSGPLSSARLAGCEDDAVTAASVHASFALFDLLPMLVIAPVMAATYLAPLREFLGSEIPDFLLWVHGPSGVFKSEVTALAQAHFGEFRRTSLPASFTATANALERLTFAMKDAVLVIDDYHPAHDPREAAQLSQTVSRLTRGVGNAAGRMRMRADTSLRPELPPRCLAIASAERMVEGHSNAARIFAVSVTPGTIGPARLSEAQAEIDRYRVAMAAYLRWLAGQADDFSRKLPERFRALRDGYRVDRTHARAAGQLAHLRLGLEVATTFAVKCGVMDESRRAELLAHAEAALLTQVREHQLGLLSEAPVELAMTYLRDGLTAKRLYLSTRKGEQPDNPGRWGWESVDDGSGGTTWRHKPSAMLLGYVDEQHLFLTPSEFYRSLVNAARANGRTFPIEAVTLWKRFVEAGIAIPGEERNLVAVRVGSESQRLLKLVIARVFAPDATGSELTAPAHPAEGPDSEIAVADVATPAHERVPDDGGDVHQWEF